MICGNEIDFTGLKFRRVGFVIIPTAASRRDIAARAAFAARGDVAAAVAEGDAAVAAETEQFLHFISFISAKSSGGAGAGRAAAGAGLRGKSTLEGWEEVGSVSVDVEPPGHSAVYSTPSGKTLRLAMDEWGGSASTQRESASAVTPAGPRAGRARSEWVLLRWDRTYNPSRCFHFEVNWLACSGASVRSMITALQRKVRALGLSLLQIPEYHRSGEYTPGLQRVDIHPFLSPVRLLLHRRRANVAGGAGDGADDDDDDDEDDEDEDDEEDDDDFEEVDPDEVAATWWPTAAFESALVGERLNFILHHVVKGNPRAKTLDARNTHRQYVHSSGVAFVRVHDSRPLVIWHINSMHSEERSDANDSARIKRELFQSSTTPARQLFSRFKQHCNAFAAAYGVVLDILDSLTVYYH